MIACLLCANDSDASAGEAMPPVSDRGGIRTPTL